jgi:hypothetical protein
MINSAAPLRGKHAQTKGSAEQVGGGGDGGLNGSVAHVAEPHHQRGWCRLARAERRGQRFTAGVTTS